MPVAAVFLPLVGSIIAGFFGRWIGDRGAQLVTCVALAIAAVFGCIVFVDVAGEPLEHGRARSVADQVSLTHRSRDHRLTAAPGAAAGR